MSDIRNQLDALRCRIAGVGPSSIWSAKPSINPTRMKEERASKATLLALCDIVEELAREVWVLQHAQKAQLLSHP